MAVLTASILSAVGITSVSAALSSTAFTVGTSAISWGVAIDTALTLGVAAASAATTAVSAAEQSAALKQQARSAEEAAAAKREAEYASARSVDFARENRLRILRAQQRDLIAKNRAALGASSIDSAGTPLLLEIDNAMNSELDIQNTAINFNEEAKGRRYSGDLAFAAGKNEGAALRAQSRATIASGMTSAGLQFGTALLTAGSSLLAKARPVVQELTPVSHTPAYTSRSARFVPFDRVPRYQM